MKEPTIRFPVSCPACGKELLTQMPVAAIAAGLLRGHNIRLFSECHGIWWTASSLEIEQIRGVPRRILAGCAARMINFGSFVETWAMCAATRRSPARS